jgi:hypothetical protein
MRRACWLTIAFVAWLYPALARSEEPRLRARLPDPIRIEVQALVDSAAAESLPGEPLIQRALEGATKHAEGPRIVKAVHLLLIRLRTSRLVLGPGASSEELVASAGCLQVGADTTDVGNLRKAGPRRSLVIPLVVLADLVGRGAPVQVASQTTLALMQAGVSDAALLSMRMGFENDILSGVSPSTSLSRRAQWLMPQSFPAIPDRSRPPGTR